MVLARLGVFIVTVKKINLSAGGRVRAIDSIFKLVKHEPCSLYPDLSDCWVWQHTKLASGYGRMHIEGVTYRIHRLAYSLLVGEIPDGMLVCHKCDNRLCCNPEHLFLGDSDANAKDMVNKGRQSKGDKHYARIDPSKSARGERHGSKTKPWSVNRGEGHCRARVNMGQVTAIRERWLFGDTMADLAREYGISETNVAYMVKNKSWKHVPHPIECLTYHF